ncbi:hypothetical protein JCM10450v2_004899 [Rhodotorula kratochvilovae]
MSSEDPAHPPTGIDKLSKEILKHIIVLVAAQDRAIRESGIPLAAAPPRTQPGVARAMIPDGKWSFWYGHGVSALSLVDKRFRELAMPFLCETVEAVQLSKPIFQFGHIPPALQAGITALDLRGATAHTFAAAALALEKLPNLCHVEYAAGLLDINELSEDSDDDESEHDCTARREYAVEAFNAASDKITEVTMQAEYKKLARNGILQSFRPFAEVKNLRRLALQSAHCALFTAFSTDMADVLKSLELVEELIFKDEASRFGPLLAAPIWQDEVSLPSLRSLTLQAEDVAVFAFVERIAPSLKYLDVTFESDSSMPDKVDSIASFPSLTSLRIAGPPLCGSFLAHVDLAHLDSLELILKSSSTGSVDCSELIPECVPLPIGLKLHLSSHRLIKLHDLEALTARCDQGGVAFSSGQHSLLSAFSPPARDTVREPSNEASRPRRDAVIEALKWADARIFECWETGDTDGVQEMAEALRKVGERKMLETL